MDPSASVDSTAFGVVVVPGGAACVRASVPLREDQLVSIVIPDSAITTARVTVLASRCADEPPSPDEHLALLDAALPPGFVGNALLREDPLVVSPTLTDLDRDGIAESYRVCTRAEGLHLSAWVGEPVAGRRIWHRYHYLGYDVEPSCTEADYDSGT